MEKIGLIVPYFGKFPKYSEIFFHSLKMNPQIDVLLFTDCKELNYSMKNLKVYYLSFDELKSIFQRKFDFPIYLDAPYKLCDFRPAFGYIFSEYLEMYDFWGHCDIDMVLGDILFFLKKINIKEYDKLYQHGHLCIYKNNSKVNNAFMLSGGLDYKKVFTTSVNCIFDEITGIQRKLDLNNFKTYKEWDFMDVNPWMYHIERATSPHINFSEIDDFDYKQQCFFWENGKVFRAAYVKNKIVYKEFNYFHFQKRDYIVPDWDIESVYSFFLMNEGVEEKKLGFDITKELIAEKNMINVEKEKEYQKKKRDFVWKRRFKKYILRRG